MKQQITLHRLLHPRYIYCIYGHRVYKRKTNSTHLQVLTACMKKTSGEVSRKQRSPKVLFSHTESDVKCFWMKQQCCSSFIRMITNHTDPLCYILNWALFNEHSSRQLVLPQTCYIFREVQAGREVTVCSVSISAALNGSIVVCL